MIEIPSKTATFPAYLALPTGGGGPGVLVLHAWWGLNAVFKSFCDRLAAEGFVALAPDLYAGQVATTRQDALATMRKMDKAVTRQALNASLKFLTTHPAVTSPRLGVVGFSMGAYYALGLAGQKPKNVAAVITFYGTGNCKAADAQAAFLGHYAEDDEFESPAGVAGLEDALRAAGRPVEFYIYPGTKHWFFETDRPEYDPAAAELAWERTLAFLRQTLR